MSERVGYRSSGSIEEMQMTDEGVMVLIQKSPMAVVLGVPAAEGFAEVVRADLRKGTPDLVACAAHYNEGVALIFLRQYISPHGELKYPPGQGQIAES